MEFITKKGLDFNDYKIICNAIYFGAHKVEEIKSLILKLSYTMNNYRLSTCKTQVKILSKQELNKLINAKPTIEHLSDGRILDLNTNKIVSNSLSCIYEIVKPNGEVLILDTLKEILEIVDVGFRTLKKYLDQDVNNNKSVIIKGYSIKRIAVFYP